MKYFRQRRAPSKNQNVERLCTSPNVRSCVQWCGATSRWQWQYLTTTEHWENAYADDVVYTSRRFWWVLTTQVLWIVWSAFFKHTNWTKDNLCSAQVSMRVSTVQWLKTVCNRDQVQALLLRTLPAYSALSSKSQLRSNSTGSRGFWSSKYLPCPDSWISRGRYRLSRQAAL